MIEVLVIFIYLFVITALTGCAAVTLLAKLLKIETGPGCGTAGPCLYPCAVFRAPASCCMAGGAGSCLFRTLAANCMAGLVLCTAYAQYVSLFTGLARFSVQIPLWIIAAAGAAGQCRQHKTYRQRKQYRQYKQSRALPGTPDSTGNVGQQQAGSCRNGSRSLLIPAAAFILLTLIFAYGTSRGITRTDTGLYHAQSIRWTMEYGTVPGLANLHLRLGYNSAAFPLTALFSFTPAAEAAGPFHGVGGFMALLLAVECFFGLADHMTRHYLIKARAGAAVFFSDLCRLAALYYLYAIFDEMISPASDYFMCIGAFYLVIRFFAIIEDSGTIGLPARFSAGRDGNLAGTGAAGAFSVPVLLSCALLSLYSVFLVSIKLSAAMLVLLAFYTLYLILRQRDKKARRIVILLLTGILIILPFILRNIILTGYILYPFPQIDLFSFDFKVPWGDAMYDQLEISVWGRGYTDVLQHDMSVSGWFPAWFAGIGTLNRGLFLLDLAAAILSPVLLLFKKNRRPALWCAYLALAASFVYWFFSAPLIRYGCVFVYLLAAFFAGLILRTCLEAGAAADAARAAEAAGVEEESRPGSRSDSAVAKLAHAVPAAFAVIAILFVCYKSVMLVREQAGVFSQPYWVWQKDYDTNDVTAYEIDGHTFYYADDGGSAGYYAFPSSPQKAQIEFRGDTLKEGFRHK